MPWLANLVCKTLGLHQEPKCSLPGGPSSDEASDDLTRLVSNDVIGTLGISVWLRRFEFFLSGLPDMGGNDTRPLEVSKSVRGRSDKTKTSGRRPCRD